MMRCHNCEGRLDKDLTDFRISRKVRGDKQAHYYLRWKNKYFRIGFFNWTYKLRCRKCCSFSKKFLRAFEKWKKANG